MTNCSFIVLGFIQGFSFSSVFDNSYPYWISSVVTCIPLIMHSSEFYDNAAEQ